MNEKRAPASEESEDPNLPRTRSDVAPKEKAQIGSGAPPRHSSGLRPAVHVPPAPPIDLTKEAELVDDGAWDDESGPTLLDTAAPAHARADFDDEPEFSHDDFPTRQAVAPMVALLMDAPRDADPEPQADRAGLAFTADSTAPMPIAPVRRLLELPVLPEVAEPSSISHPYVLPQPVTSSGAPLPPPANVRSAFLDALSPNDDPPLKKLVLVTVMSFLSTLLFAAFVAWIVYLVKH